MSGAAFGIPETPPCPCCEGLGALPHLPGIVEAVPREVVLAMCDRCIGAAFLGEGKHPHSMDGVVMRL